MMIHVWRRTPTLLFALFTLVLIARPAGAEHKNGFQFRAEGAYAEFFTIDSLTGIVTDVSMYAADDEGYRATGDTAPERGSTLIVSITQYDPACQGGGGKLDVGPEAGGGDPSCFYRELSGMLPTKDGA